MGPFMKPYPQQSNVFTFISSHLLPAALLLFYCWRSMILTILLFPFRFLLMTTSNGILLEMNLLVFHMCFHICVFTCEMHFICKRQGLSLLFMLSPFSTASRIDLKNKIYVIQDQNIRKRFFFSFMAIHSICLIDNVMNLICSSPSISALLGQKRTLHFSL